MNKFKDELLNQKISFPHDNGEVIDWLTRSTIEFQFSAINQHLDFLRKSMMQEMNNLKERASRLVEDMNVDDEEIETSIYHSLLQDEHYQFHDEFPQAINAIEQIQWRSNFIVLYSLFEFVLNEICYAIEKKSSFKLKLTDIHGSGIERAKDYLTKVAEMKMPFQQKDWDRVILLSKIRHKIVHTYGEVDEKMIKQLKKDIDTNNIELNITEKRKKIILLSYKFVKQSANELQKIVIEICNYPLYTKKC
jgi:hypothetical protein